MASLDASLEELAARVRETRGEADLRALAEALCQDPRAGARDLARRCQRLAEGCRVEQLRLGALWQRQLRLQRAGARFVAGIDEVGMGPLAGPVVAAAVVLGDLPDLPGLDDSKRLSARARERLAQQIEGQAVALALGSVSPAEIDRRNIYQAGLEAMRRAVTGLPLVPDHLLVDGRHVPGVDIPQTRVTGGDRREASIAAASIVAKVHRDRLMCRLDDRYPGYGFARHKGYPTPEHIEALERLGATPVHRRSFAPVPGPR